MTAADAGHAVRPQGDAATVLVVEDEVLVRMSLALDLVEAGYRVIEAADAAEAISVLESGQGVDLVFSDVHMPGALDGIGLWRLIGERWPHVPVILTSAYTPQASALAPDVVFIPKPYVAPVVLRAIGSRIRPRQARGGAGAA